MRKYQKHLAWDSADRIWQFSNLDVHTQLDNIQRRIVVVATSGRVFGGHAH